MAMASHPDFSDRRKKILFVSHESSRTGAPICLLHFLRWLKNHTTQPFEILLAREGPLKQSFQELAPVHSRASFLSDPSLIRQFGLVHSNTIFNGRILSEILSEPVPVVTHVHELDSAYEFIGPRNLAAVFRHTSHFVACSQIVASRLREIFNLPGDQISVHYEMVDPLALNVDNAKAQALALRGQLGIPDDPFIITACGACNSRKAPDLFLQFAYRLKHLLGPNQRVIFLWVGQLASGDFMQTLERDILKAGMRGEVHFIGEVPSAHPFISMGDLFCLPSREDPFPLVMLEAALLGKPILCFDQSGGAAEFNERSGGTPSPYFDVGHMGQLAFDLLQDSQRRAAAGRAAAAAVESHFTVESVAPVLWAQLEGFLHSPPKPSPFVSAAVPLEQIYRSWNPAENLWRLRLECQFQRAEVRRQAALLAGAGRNQEAVGALFQRAAQDLSIGDSVISCEALLEIGTDLARLAPIQSAELLQQFEQLRKSDKLIELQVFREPSAGLQ